MGRNYEFDAVTGVVSIVGVEHSVSMSSRLVVTSLRVLSNPWVNCKEEWRFV